MSSPTCRDRIWMQALKQARVYGRFRASAIDVDCADRTVRKTLASMEGFDLLARTTPQSGIWYAGPRLLRIMNVTERALEAGLEESEAD